MKRLLSVLLIACSLLFAAAAFATTVVKLNFDQLVLISDAIVVGEVASVDGVVQDGRVFTHVDVKIRETLKGDVQRRLKIVHIGGRTKKLVTRVAGMPSFRKGELALLFLEQPKNVPHFVVTGLAQGKMELTKAEDGELRLARDLAHLNTVDLKLPSADLDVSKAADPTIVPPPIETLDAARARIAELLKSDSSTKTEE